MIQIPDKPIKACIHCGASEIFHFCLEYYVRIGNTRRRTERYYCDSCKGRWLWYRVRADEGIQVSVTCIGNYEHTLPVIDVEKLPNQNENGHS